MFKYIILLFIGILIGQNIFEAGYNAGIMNKELEKNQEENRKLKELRIQLEWHNDCSRKLDLLSPDKSNNNYNIYYKL